jgi:hypothetical protein
MKKLLTLAFTMVFFTAAISLSAQDKPAPSPFSKLEQKVGTTDVSIEYSRPSVKGRTIFAADGLVPYGKVWRTGANSVTKITFSKDVKVEGKSLAAGSYALFTLPGKDSWEVHFKPYGQAGVGSYNEVDAAVVVSVKPVSLGDMEVESFTIFIDNLRDTSGTLMLLWSNVAVPVQLGVM